MQHRTFGFLCVLAPTLLFAACSAEPGRSDSATPDIDGGISIDGGNGSDSDGNIDPIDRPAPPGCGDGALTPDEVCDDGNLAGNDGCYANCLGIDKGFTCPTPGELCKPFARCGDGFTAFPEQCDDGNLVDNDGCSKTCKVEVGSKCTTDAPSVCSATTCGDGAIEGAETCDDTNALPFDGCSEKCVSEPKCTDQTGASGPCTSSCGDGIVLGEECDDGNKTNGDGCSSACKPEAGYTCTQAACAKDALGQCLLTIPAIFRDFAESHSDFENTSCKGDVVVPNLVKPALKNGKPERAGTTGCMDNFAQWYTDVAGTNATFVGSLDLFDNGSGGFVNRYGKDGEKWIAPTSWACPAGNCPYDGNPLFFPIDGLVGVKDDGGKQAKIGDNYGIAWAFEADIAGHTNTGPHNFYFTSEVTYWFQYDASQSAKLDFNGDDDVWVFVNGTLAVDLGGVHSAKSDSITLSSANAATYGLEDGKVFAIQVFHAERMWEGSTFKLTLSGFESSRSDCAAQCGDGIIGFVEECDDGVNDGGYNECQPGCVLGGYCGDGVVQEAEDCDDVIPADSAGGCGGCRYVVVK